jgi:arabinonate dehydratase
LQKAPPRWLRLDERDNVAVALAALKPGEEILGVRLADPIALGHKLALVAIPEGGEVIKYGEVIGIATAAIEPGHHVHVHNVRSARLPGAP